MPRTTVRTWRTGTSKTVPTIHARAIAALFAELRDNPPERSIALVPADKAREQINALLAGGYSRARLAAELQVSPCAVREWSNGNARRMSATLAPRIAALYAELRDSLPDPTQDPRRYIDEIELESLIAGHLPPERSHYRYRHNREAVGVLTRRGLTALQIAERLNITERSVVRHRSALAAQARATEAHPTSAIPTPPLEESTAA